jgi:hypothetical protein
VIASPANLMDVINVEDRFVGDVVTPKPQNPVFFDRKWLVNRKLID